MTRRQVWISPKRSTDGHCIEDGCPNALPGRRLYFCSKECDEAWHLRHDWRVLRSFVFKRDDYTCRLCGQGEGYEKVTNYVGYVRVVSVRGLQADHIVPIADGGDEFDPANVRTLCVPCHKRVTAQWRREKARARREGGTARRGTYS